MAEAFVVVGVGGSHHCESKVEGPICICLGLAFIEEAGGSFIIWIERREVNDGRRCWYVRFVGFVFEVCCVLVEMKWV